MVKSTGSKSGDPVVELFREQFSALEALADEVPDEAWSTPTGCPGWTVQDCFSHALGTEAQLMGRSEESPPIDHLDYITTDFQRMVEAPVELRRGRPPADIRAELHEVLGARMSMLDAEPAEAFEADSWTPVGPGTYRDFMRIRVFDLWMHEQDVRAALQRPGHLTGPVVDTVMGNLGGGLPAVVVKRAGAPVGATVRFVFTDDVRPPVQVEVFDRDGKARGALAEPGPETPTVQIALPFESFVQLCGGRSPARNPLTDPAPRLDGDRDLGAAVLASLSMTP